MTSNTIRFLRDVESHVMEVFRDDGVNRHLRFRKPGTMCMHFDIITWPGYLCYTGDMGTYVFRRLHDMLEFFRRNEGDQAFRIDMRYWAEKCEAADKSDGISKFSLELFKEAVKDYFEQATDDEEGWPVERKAALWHEIEQDVLFSVEGEYDVFSSLRDFDFDGFSFSDWESSCKEYTFRFRWCCHALEWAIGVYDKQTKQAPALVNTAQPAINSVASTEAT